MILRSIIGLVGAIQLLAPRRVTRFWLARCCRNPEEIEVKPWVLALVRLEGLVLIGWVLWKSREDIAEATGSDRLPGMGDAGEEEPWVSTEEEEESSAAEERQAPTPETTSEAESEPAETDDRPTLTPGTRRFELASVLYHADEPLTVADFVDLSEGTDWEVGRSPASTTLYRMYNDDAVDRQEGPEGSYEYWLTDAGRDVLEEADAEIEPNPFAGAEAA